MFFVFFFQAEDGIRDHCVTGVQTCALPISDAGLQFHQVTFRRGQIWGARFAPDGRAILYTANWDDGPRRLFLTNPRSEEHTSELQSHSDLVCRLLLEKKKNKKNKQQKRENT